MSKNNISLKKSIIIASFLTCQIASFTGNILVVAAAENQINVSADNQAIELTEIELQRIDNQLKLILQTGNGEIPRFEIKKYDNYTLIKLYNTKLQAANDEYYWENDPIPGVNSLNITQAEATEIHIKITGDQNLLNIAKITNQNPLTFSIISNLNLVDTSDAESIDLFIIGTRDTTATAPANITIIDREEIERLQPRDVRDLLRYQPGISVPNDTRGGLQGINIRGLGGNRVNLRVDGIRLPDEFSFGATRIGRDYVDIETLNALEVFRGNNSAILSSDALGGTVNFQTARAANLLDILGKDSFTSARVQYGSKDSGLVGTLTQANRWNNLETLFIYTRRDSGSLQVGGGNSIFQDDVDRTRDNFLGTLTYNLNPQSFLELTGEYFNNVTNSNFAQANLPGMSFEAASQNLQEEVTTNRNRLSLTYEYDNPNSQSLINFARFNAYFQNSGITEDSRRSVLRAGNIVQEEADKEFIDQIFGANLQLRSNLQLGTLNNRITYGLDISNSYNERNNVNFITTTGTRVTAPNSPQKDFPDSTTFRLGLYAQNEMTFGDGNLTIIPGLRFDIYDLQTANNVEFTQRQQGVDAAEFSGSAVSPSLGLVYEPSPGLTLFGRYSRGFRPPIYSEMNFAFRADIPFRPHKGISNPDLQAETSNNFELGLRSRSQNFDIDITGFYNRFNNFIQPTVFVGFDNNDFGTFTSGGNRIPFQVFQAQNIPDASIFGLEIKTVYRLSEGPGGFRLQGSLGWQVGNDLTQNIPINSINPLQAVIGLGYQSPDDRWGLDLIGTLVARAREQALVDDQGSVRDGGLPTRQIDFYEPDGYALLDLIGYYNFSRNVTLTAGIFNIFNTEYFQYADVRNINTNSPAFEAQRGRFAQPGTNFNLGLIWRF